MFRGLLSSSGIGGIFIPNTRDLVKGAESERQAILLRGKAWKANGLRGQQLLRKRTSCKERGIWIDLKESGDDSKKYNV
jgi:hypothetical protein